MAGSTASPAGRRRLTPAPNSRSATTCPSTITCSARSCSRSVKKRPPVNVHARLIDGIITSVPCMRVNQRLSPGVARATFSWMPPATYCTPGDLADRLGIGKRHASPPSRGRLRDRRAAAAPSDDRASPSDRLQDGTRSGTHVACAEVRSERVPQRVARIALVRDRFVAVVELRPPVAGTNGELVEAGRADLLLDRALRAGADRHHRQHRRHADGDAEHGQAGLQAIAAQRLDRDVDHGVAEASFHVKPPHPERAFRSQSGRNASRMGLRDPKRSGHPGSQPCACHTRRCRARA